MRLNISRQIPAANFFNDIGGAHFALTINPTQIFTYYTKRNQLDFNARMPYRKRVVKESSIEAWL